VNDTAPQTALREWRSHMARPVRALALIGAVVILAIAGPFDTADILRPLPRLGYWSALVGLSYSAGYCAHLLADRAAPRSLWRRIAIAGGATGLSVLAIVYLLNGLAFGSWARGSDLGSLAATVMGIAMILATIFQVADTSEPADARPAARPPALLDRLPIEKRGPLVSLSVEDHYVRIRTTRGEAMVLLRLADAIREVGDTPGLQVHRSHWIALGHVAGVARNGDGAILTMTHGDAVPVSRANMARIREAGLLPR
jgi:hypothetical protein